MDNKTIKISSVVLMIAGAAAAFFVPFFTYIFSGMSMYMTVKVETGIKRKVLIAINVAALIAAAVFQFLQMKNSVN